jgi:hypothetical protein
MTNRKAIIPLGLAALLTATAGPAMAKKQTSEQVTAAEQQAKKKKAKSGENCFLKAPPFMRNPRYMNRGFFKKKCYKTNE